MPRTETDLLIVGTGPAGSMAGYHAAKLGLKVLILKKTAASRTKPCAGGLSNKTLAQLPFSVRDIVENTTGSLNIGLDGKRHSFASTPGTICAFTNRSKFDHRLLERALAAGAKIQTISGVAGLEIGQDSIQLKTNDRHSIRAKYLIAADGANSQIRRMVVPHLKFSRGFAIEGIMPLEKLDRLAGMELNFDCVDYGYGWLFPKTDHVSVGLYTSNVNVKLSKAALLDFAHLRLGKRDITEIYGFPLGFGGHTYVQASERVLFAGDAARMCEPLLGEGIHNAIKSGELAAKTVSQALQSGNPVSASYNRALHDIRRDLLRCRIAASIFYPNVRRFGYAALVFPKLSNSLMRGFAAGQTFYHISNRAAFPYNPGPVHPASLD